MSMQIQKPIIPKKYLPKGFEIIHEDLDLLVVNKEIDMLSVPALWNKTDTVFNGLDKYVKKGNPRASKTVFVVHRLDQATSGVLVFAKSEKAQQFLKNSWQQNIKTYYAIVNGHFSKKTDIIESYLEEDEDYAVKSTDGSSGKLARTQYEVIKEVEKFSLIKINLLTGKKNQIRVHFSEKGCPIVGDAKYGDKNPKNKQLMLHAYSLEITHPFKKERILFEAPIPERFQKLIKHEYK
jgi:RluA family pseudouridine synthase